MSRTIFALVVALFVAGGCSSRPASRPGGPDPRETPPRTTDPGAVQDTDPMPEQPMGSSEGAGGSMAPTSGKPAGSTCLLATECSSGVCEGQGCGNDSPGTCASEARGCTRDLRTYCGCDGKTFQSSGSCPGRRYLAREACK